MLAPIKNIQEILAKNAELTARLKVSDERNRRLREENDRLNKLQPQNERLTERVVLLEEEVRWLKAQFFGHSSQIKCLGNLCRTTEDALQRGGGAGRDRGSRGRSRGAHHDD